MMLVEDIFLFVVVVVVLVACFVLGQRRCFDYEATFQLCDLHK